MITARLMEDIRAQEEKFSKAFHSSPNAVLLTRVGDGVIFEVNQGFEQITGWKRAEVLSKTTHQLGLWMTDEARNDFVTRLGTEEGIHNVTLTFRRKNGVLFTGLLSAEKILIGAEWCVISTIGDITEQHRLQMKLEEMASHDALTGLANRRLFYDRFEIALSNARRIGRKLAVVSLDLDRFKAINDNWGHETGDLVLVESARRLTACLRGVDTVARFGGDEFVLLLWDIGEDSAATHIALKILEQFRIPFATGSGELILHASIGLALYPDAGTELATLLRKSDQALYEVKESGRDNFRFATN
jgi:diguanylate cyclase (GGDEF)-like protein/PAS domain S-box-containing protein